MDAIHDLLPQSVGESNYSVYWIHLDDQRNPFTEGYVGVTNNIDRRWKRHRRHDAKLDCKRNDFPLYAAFRRFGLGRFSFEILVCQLDNWSAHNLEYALRPHKRIGYNIAPGGFMRSCFLCSSLSPLTEIESHARRIAEHILEAARILPSRPNQPLLGTQRDEALRSAPDGERWA